MMKFASEFKSNGTINEMELNSVFRRCLMNSSFQLGTAPFEKCIRDSILSMVMTNNSKNTFSIILQILFAISICTGIVGNTLVIVSVIFFHFMRNFANIFLLNLAISDLLVITIAAPPTLINYVDPVYQFSPFFCRLQSCLQATSVHVSVLSLMSISLERFLVVRFPLRYKVIFKNKRIKIWLFSIWLLSIVLSVPLALASELVEKESSSIKKTQCKETWSNNQDNKKAYTLTSFFILYLIPLFLMFILHFVLISKLWQMPSEITNTVRNIDYSNRRRKLSIILIVLCLIFLICWLPHHLRCIYNDFKSKGNGFDNSSGKIDEFIVSTLTPISHVMCYLNSSINPYCSLIISTKFRYCVRFIFQCLYSTVKHREFSRNNTNINHTRKPSSQYLARVRSINVHS